MSNLTPEQELKIRQLLDEGDRQEERVSRAEREYILYRPWLWFSALGRWIATSFEFSKNRGSYMPPKKSTPIDPVDRLRKTLAATDKNKTESK